MMDNVTVDGLMIIRAMQNAFGGRKPNPLDNADRDKMIDIMLDFSVRPGDDRETMKRGMIKEWPQFMAYCARCFAEKP